MRAVVQRVLEARIEVDGRAIGAMGSGLLVLVGVARDDGPAQAEALARKLVGLRLFDDDAGRMGRSLLEAGGTLGVVSQFTLQADVRKGRRPSWSRAAPAEQALPLLDALVRTARALGAAVVTGRFGAHMHVHLVNDGPVTLVVDVD